MNTIKCTNCGKLHLLEMTSAGAVSEQVTLKCSDCGSPLITLDVKQSDQRLKKFIFFLKRKLYPFLILFFQKVRQKPKLFIYSILMLAIASYVGLSMGYDTRPAKPLAAKVSTKKVSPAADRSAFYRLSKDDRRLVQAALRDHYNYRGTIDGLWGPQTSQAYYRMRNAEANEIKGFTHFQVFTNISQYQKRRNAAPGQVINNLLGAYLFGKTFGGGWVNPNTGQQVDPARGWRSNQNGTELRGYSCEGPHSFLKRTRHTANGTLCDYQNGTTINIGIGICPLTCN